MQNDGGAEFLLDFSARKLDAVQHALVERHLAACASCAALVRSQQAVWDALDEWDRIEISPDFNRRLYDGIAGEERRNPLSRWAAQVASRWTPLSWRAAVPAVAVCAAFVVALVVQPPRPWVEPATGPASPSIEKIDVEQVERALEDLEMLRQFSPRA